MKNIIPGLSNAEYVAIILDKEKLTLLEKMGGEVGVGMGSKKEPFPPYEMDSGHGKITRANENSYYYTFKVELYGRIYKGVLETEYTGRGIGKPWLETLEVPHIRDLKRWEMHANIVKLMCYYRSANGTQKTIDLTDSNDEDDLYDELMEILLSDGEFHWAMQDFDGEEIENLKYENWLNLSDQVRKMPKGPVGFDFSFDFNNYSMSDGYEATSSNIYRKSYTGTLEVTFDDSVNLFDNILFKEFSYLKKQKGNGDPEMVYVDGIGREAYNLFNSILNNSRSFKDAIVGFESSFDDRGDYE